MELKDTVEMMNSKDYKERFIAEYWQLKIRYEKLKSLCNKMDAAYITKSDMPKHDCPVDLLDSQKYEMGKLLHILEVRAVIEKIDLEGVK